MTTRSWMTCLAALTISGGVTACMTGPVGLGGPRVLAQAPPDATLRPGEVVLVDDGSCPAGQIKQVIGGSNRVYLTNVPRPGTPRQTSCIGRAQ